MCGIVGYLGHENAIPLLVEGLRRLEYRGYDSAGIACLVRHRIKVVKQTGDVAQLAATIPDGLSARIGIAHTRWATHGAVTMANAHPHVGASGRVAIVHNGIIYNASALQDRLRAAHVPLASGTDSEVVAQLADQFLAAGQEPEQAVRSTLAAIEGTYGLLFLFRDHPELLIAARQGSPLSVGIGDGLAMVASDPQALGRLPQQLIHLEDGELAVVTRAGCQVRDRDDQPVAKRTEPLPAHDEETTRGEFPDLLTKEIYEQPASVERAFRGRLVHEFGTAKLGGLNVTGRDLLDVRRIELLGMGTAYHACLIGAYLFETMARIPARAEIASELRLRNPIVERETLYLAVSQSGETADTLLALREIRHKGGRVLGIVNAVGSTIARAVDGGIYTHAGPERSVASTKAFTGQLTALVLLAVQLARMRHLSLAEGRLLVHAIESLPDLLRATLGLDADARRIAQSLRGAAAVYVLGRGLGHALALEGALKIAELSYQVAIGMSAADLKHGPIAVLERDMPVIVIAIADDTLEKTLVAMEEARARGARVIAITNSADARLDRLASAVLRVPPSRAEIAPILLALPLQLIAAHLARALERTVDRPRHLAKSVTVE